MHKGKYVFAQLLDFIDKDVFAVRIQIYSAIIAYCMMAIVQKKMNVERSIYEMLQIVSVSLTDTNHLRDLFAKPNCNIVNELDDSPNQICLIVKLYNNRPKLLPDSNECKYKYFIGLWQSFIIEVEVLSVQPSL